MNGESNGGAPRGPRFRRIREPGGPQVTVQVEGQPVQVPAGETAAAAALAAGLGHTRTTPVTGAARGPYCMMGVCFDCLMEIDGAPNRQACMVRVSDGMRINRQHGMRPIEP